MPQQDTSAILAPGSERHCHYRPIEQLSLFPSQVHPSSLDTQMLRSNQEFSPVQQAASRSDVRCRVLPLPHTGYRDSSLPSNGFLLLCQLHDSFSGLQKKKGLLFRQVLTEANCDDNAVVPFNVNHEIAWCPKRIKSDLEDFVDFSWRVSEIYRRTGVGYHLSFFCVLRDP